MVFRWSSKILEWRTVGSIRAALIPKAFSRLKNDLRYNPLKGAERYKKNVLKILLRRKYFLRLIFLNVQSNSVITNSSGPTESVLYNRGSL